MALPVVPTTTNASKQIAVDALSLALSNRHVRIIPDPVLIRVASLSGERLPSGVHALRCTSRMHVMTVMAVMLAISGADAGPISIRVNLCSTQYRCFRR